jgi:glycosyltransferase involved in cell wall biosynthesis
MSDLEVIVVDNMSVDETASIAKRIRDDRVHVFRCDRMGAAAARNRGLKIARGTYIQFLDADDLLHAEKIRLQLNVMSDRDPVYTVASCTWQRFEASLKDSHEVQEKAWPIEDPLEWLVCSLSGGGMMQTGAWLVHRDLVDAAGPWDESLSLHDDGEFFTRILLKAKSQVFVPDARVYYRSVSNSLSRRRSRGAVESAFKVCQLRDRHLLAVIDDSRSRSAIATQYAQFAYEFSMTAPDLTALALNRIRQLEEKPINSIGGPTFRRLTGLLGFRNSLAIRRSLVHLMARRA